MYIYILVRTLRIERSVSKDPVGFEQCIEKGKILTITVKQWGFCGNNVDLFLSHFNPMSIC